MNNCRMKSGWQKLKLFHRSRNHQKGLKTVSKTFDIKLDIEKNLYSPMQILFYVSNTDVDSVELNFEIIQDDAPFDLTGTSLQMAIKKPSGAVIYEGIEITSAPEGKANTT